jgi:tryptophan halogenase
MSHNKIFPRQENGAPLITHNFGYHIENRRFVAYLETKAAERGIEIIDDIVTSATQNEHGLTGVHLESGRNLTADFYVDCSGFRTLLVGKTLNEPFISYKSTLFCDRAVVSAWERTDEPIQPYTTAETMDAGWCWRIDHPDYINRGNVYSSAFIKDEDAERELRSKNPSVQKTWIVKFASGRFERSWVKNVVAVGNAAGFVEPLESTALAVICDEARILAEVLADCDRQPTSGPITQYNRINARAWDSIRDFLGIHYKFNTRLNNTPFWQACRADAELGPIQDLVDYFQDRGPSSFWRFNQIHFNDMFRMEGYLAMFVGQKLPYQARYTPTADETRVWKAIQARHRQMAESAYSVRDALSVIMSPDCRWRPGYFKVPLESQMTSFTGSD